MLRILFALLVFVSSNGIHAQTSKLERLVVAVPSTGEALPESSTSEFVLFFPSEVVTVLKTKGSSALVRGDDDGRSAWLPRAALVESSSFRAMRAWRGQDTFELSSASGDSGQTYRFMPDGTFFAKYDDNREPRKWSGRLYQSGLVIWAKPNRGSESFDYWSVFRQLPNGKLCMLNFDTPLGCECVETYGRGLTSSCK